MGIFAASASAALPIYFESSWSILSIIGMWNFFIALILLSIIGRSKILYVPLVVSVATAIANGMCFYAFYMNYAVVNTAVASAFADIFWATQEAGLSFYSYIMLARWLKGTARAVFMSIFWCLIACIVALRGAILIARVKFILEGAESNQHRQNVINHLHSGYFTAIALVELNSAFFLLRNFSRARKFSLKAAMKDGLLGHLMRSTEVRLALLAVIGVTRAVTYSFQSSIQSADSVASQIDRFIYTTECLFPIVMLYVCFSLLFRQRVSDHGPNFHSVDILASRLVAADGGSASVSSRSRAPSKSVMRRTGQPPRAVGQSVVNIHAVGTDKDDDSMDGTKQIELANMTMSMGGISRTVEFEVYDGDGRRTDLASKV
ncbi:hypothetical protein BKA62DRAFT_624827 [Auriculariales sp. MPI-PUGE-AT-0066]|nr:hypothetical protein BKA62DRAFT_624827 [Auriculariales sp. MPI-PUGE-AT-0066]